MNFYDKFVDRIQDIPKFKKSCCQQIFLYRKNNNFVEHVQKVLLIVLFIYFQDKVKFSYCIWLIWFRKWNHYFSACERKFAKVFMSF